MVSGSLVSAIAARSALNANILPRLRFIYVSTGRGQPSIRHDTALDRSPTATSKQQPTRRAPDYVSAIPIRQSVDLASVAVHQLQRRLHLVKLPEPVFVSKQYVASAARRESKFDAPAIAAELYANTTIAATSTPVLRHCWTAGRTRRQ